QHRGAVGHRDLGAVGREGRVLVIGPTVGKARRRGVVGRGRHHGDVVARAVVDVIERDPRAVGRPGDLVISTGEVVDDHVGQAPAGGDGLEVEAGDAVVDVGDRGAVGAHLGLVDTA